MKGRNKMQLLKEKILSEGRVDRADILKVDGFLNHQIDVKLLNEIGKEFERRYNNDGITKILTIEASGIAIACFAALYLNVPVIYAKKTESKNLEGDTYQTQVYSYTKDRDYQVRVSKRYLKQSDRVLIIDDFLANGNAVFGLKEIVEQAGAKLIGVGIVIEKGFQQGGKLLREQGIRVDSLAILKSISPGQIIFE
jgi:xanthine phosphoribosyltransferase